MHALQDLGSALVALSPAQIRQLNLPDLLGQALLDAKSLRAHGAVRRQMQYIGKLMRNVDPAPIQEFLDRLAGTSQEATAALHRTERWRERLMTDVTAVDDFAREFPTVDRQQLRQLVLAAQKEKTLGKPPRQYRALFRTLIPFLDPHAPGQAHHDDDA
ncbi:MAG: DUF615 domain-containing protein [Ferrovum sp.]|nr:DUF615 domain-containing protein [Ferrovum sp.]NDU87715.1 DUF615 domain-containing protein [Ferrovum sp.]